MRNKTMPLRLALYRKANGGPYVRALHVVFPFPEREALRLFGLYRRSGRTFRVSMGLN